MGFSGETGFWNASQAAPVLRFSSPCFSLGWRASDAAAYLPTAQPGPRDFLPGDVWRIHSAVVVQWGGGLR
jgi:hypothetical protein